MSTVYILTVASLGGAEAGGGRPPQVTPSRGWNPTYN